MIVKLKKRTLRKIGKEWHKKMAKIENEERRIRNSPEFVIFMRTPIGI
ncbi:MAG: hypothetical protein Q7R84_02265 [bacterium]|nr:hypothetical protein [bacterium]